MEYLIGALVMALLFVVLATGYMLGKRSKSPKTKDEVDEETKRRAKKIQQDFQRMMSYDVSKALGRREG